MAHGGGLKGHNPYFNRWFSAIKRQAFVKMLKKFVTILILIDGFLQFLKQKILTRINMSQSLF